MTKVIIIKEYLKKSINKGALHILVGNFLTKFVNLFGTICLVRVLSKQEYGVLSYVENLYGFLYLLVGLGLNNAVIRYVLLEESLNAKYNVFSYVLKRGSLYNVIIIFVGYFINYIYPHPSEFSSAQNLLYLMILVIPFAFCVESSFCNERAFLNNKSYIYMSVIIASGIIISKITGGILFCITGVIVFYLIFEAIAGIICVIYEKHKYYRDRTKIKISKQLEKNINIYSIQFMLTNSIWAMFLLLDVFMLAQFLNNEELIADYKVAYTIPACLSILSSAVGMFVAPYFIKNENNETWIRKNYVLCFVATFLFVAVVAFIIGICSKYIICILYGREYLNILPLMRILLISAVADAGIRYTSANVLAAIGAVKYNLIVSVMAIILQVFINLFMIPQYGVYGPAITSILTYLFMGCILFIVLNKKYSILQIRLKS